ncbi:hypothetical protein BS17DRAFT_534233 [Gyrodon lividus]|nr:hypothetical protein BS17DRAFT_534233 [Gyrodon lividus]
MMATMTHFWTMAKFRVCMALACSSGFVIFMRASRGGGGRVCVRSVTLLFSISKYTPHLILLTFLRSWYPVVSLACVLGHGHVEVISYVPDIRDSGQCDWRCGT